MRMEWLSVSPGRQSLARRAPAGRTLVRQALMLLLSFAALAAMRGAAEAQLTSQAEVATRTVTSATPSITLDASSLNHVTAVELPWRFHAGTTLEDHTYASPAFDDSAWPAVPAGATFASLHLPNVQARIAWTRIHLHIANASAQQLGILLDDRGPRYRVFANGQPIGETPDFASGHVRGGQAFVIALPQVPEITLAVEFYASDSRIFEYYARLPVQALAIGELNLVAATADLNRVRHFDSNYLINILEAVLYLGFAPVAFILYRNQRDHTEYLWLGLFLLGDSCFNLLGTLGNAGGVPLTTFATLELEGAAFLGTVLTSLEFVLRFSGVRRGRAAQVFEALLIVAPLSFLIDYRVTGVTILVCLGGWFLFIVSSLVMGYRRGRRECGLLLLPLSGLASTYFLLYLSAYFGVRLPFETSWTIGPIRFDIGDIAMMGFLASLIALILVRFVRVSREEQRTASELEAARTVQQVLVPEQNPEVPGYEIATIYRAAQQVGGDFFQIIPLAVGAAGAGDVLIVAGDVTGKGLQAGMLVALLVGAIRSAAETDPDPLSMLKALNRRLLGRGASQATCLAMLVTPEGAVTLANAGHIPPYRNGEPIAMEGALPLGMIDEAEFSVMHFQLQPGDKLVVVSDGVLEATSAAGELFGFERVAGMLKARLSIEELADAAQRFGQQDDISLVALTRMAL